MGLDVQNNKYIDIANGMVVTGVVGACVSAPLNYLAQKSMIKHSAFWIDKFDKSLANAKNQKQKDACKKTIDYLKKGNVNWKSIGKNALFAGIFCATFSFVYNLIKSLFIRDEKITI